MKMPNLSLSEKAQILVDCGDLIPVGDGFYEDMGGHIVHEDSCIESYFEHLWNHTEEQVKKDILEQMEGEK